ERHTATLLPTGQVLVTGGVGFNGEFVTALDTAELYDPASGAWHLTGGMHDPRVSHTATLLPNGQLVVAGGTTAGADFPGGTPLATAELYAPAHGPGQVYVTNYLRTPIGTVLVIDPATNTVVATVRVGDAPTDVAITPDGARAYVANFGGDVSVIDTAT